MRLNWDTAFVMLPLLLGAYFLLTVSHWSRHLRNPGLRRFLFFTSLVLGSLCLVCLALFVAGCLFGWDMPDWLFGKAAGSIKLK